MKFLKPLFLFTLFLLATGCASYGPKLVIETSEPAEDFVVLCEWYKFTLFGGGHGGKERVGDKVFVTESGKEVDCGANLSGGDGLANIFHPTYIGSGVTAKEKSSENIHIEDGVAHIKITKTKLDLLDEQKAKFEAGYWDKNRNPGARYAESLGGCGFPYQYFDYYSQVKKVDKEHFKKLYQKPMLECMHRSFSVTKKYRPNASSKLPSADEWMRQMWKSNAWSKYE